MTYLVDANVLSEPTMPLPDVRVVEWLQRNEHDVAVGPIILGEVRFGILEHNLTDLRKAGVKVVDPFAGQ